MSLLWKTAVSIADSPSGYPANVVQMSPKDLVRYADPTRMTDQHSRRRVEELAQEFRERGYQTKKHNGMDQWGMYSYAQPIHLVHHDEDYSSLMNGNHRAWAAYLAGLDRVPVTVTDMRGERRR